MRLFIYLLDRLPASRNGSGWDEAHGFVVRARSSTRARQLVAEAPSYECGPGCEGGDVWRDPRQSRCRKLGEVTPGANTREAIILRNFRAG
jgi:hypothetical protein